MCYAIRRRNAGCSCIRNYRPDGEWRWRRCWRCEQVVMAVTVRCQYWLRTSSLQQQLDDAVTVRLMRSTAAAVRSAVAWQFIAVCHHNWHSATSGSFAVLITVHVPRAPLCSMVRHHAHRRPTLITARPSAEAHTTDHGWSADRQTQCQHQMLTIIPLSLTLRRCPVDDEASASVTLSSSSSSTSPFDALWLHTASVAAAGARKQTVLAWGLRSGRSCYTHAKKSRSNVGPKASVETTWLIAIPCLLTRSIRNQCRTVAIQAFLLYLSFMMEPSRVLSLLIS